MFCSAIAVAALGTLSGCATTQEKAARLQLNAARVGISLKPTRVTTAGHRVQAVKTSVVSADGRSAFVVTVRNRSSSAISDLPISVGYTLGSTRVFLNAAAGRGYFGSHLPAVYGGRELTWVYQSAHGLPTGARPFAVVGPQEAPSADVTTAVAVQAVRLNLKSSTLRAKVTNLSDIPQYQLQIYAHTRGSGADASAGAATIAELDGGATRVVRIRLVGHSNPRRIQIQAIPTILQ